MPSLKSMTGFGRSSGQHDGRNWQWSVKSVNGKGLDLRFRLPAGLDELEPELRKMAVHILSRGNVQIALEFGSAGGASGFDIDDALLAKLQDKVGLYDTDTLTRLLAVPGVVRPVSAPSLDGDEGAALKSKLRESFKAALDALNAARDKEGAAMGQTLSAQIEQLDALIKAARAYVADRPERLRAAFAAKLDALLGDNLPEDRLAQEAAILAVKADVYEELDRLDAHITLARSHLKSTAPVGRKLDFLAQEFNREINTLCSKSGDADLTQMGLEMKTVLEQFREQSANIE